MPRYNPAIIEPEWQQYWETNKTFAAPRLPGKKKFYALDMFPYPSGSGLHVGHPEGYTATDIVCRYKRMLGYSVMHPMGWDAFGLPAEQHAKLTGTHPRVTTEKNIATFKRQLKMLGFSYDWDREVATTDVDYFRWTQEIFLLLYDTWYDSDEQRGRPISELPIPRDIAADSEATRHFQDDHRLAYQHEALVNWCPKLGTVLANEEVIGGLSERGNHPVVRIPLRQWMLRITHYADRLEEGLDTLDWSDGVKALQRNWIGRSVGAEVDFYIGFNTGVDGKPLDDEYTDWLMLRSKSGMLRKPDDEVLRIYTTRPDTLFGATYMVISPEHPAVRRLTMADQKEAVEAYCEEASRKTDLDRTVLSKTKTGVFTGSHAINPVNGEFIPIWVADYVLAGYGTGAIMAVPAHDTRDFEFAKTFGLPIVPVVDPGDNCDPAAVEGGGKYKNAAELRNALLSGDIAFAADGVAINSGKYNKMETPQMKEAITADLAETGYGRAAVNYKLRDWLFSRQHFWGEPFPILHELDEKGHPTGRLRTVPSEELPLDIPADMKFNDEHNSPEPPLDDAPEDWLYVTIDGVRYKRETNSMPQWAGSCWYYLRYLDPKNSEAMVDSEIERSWMPVDLYIGGAEHAVLHLLYARFWHKVLYDRGFVTTDEPFQKLVNQGMILGEAELTGYQGKDGAWVSLHTIDKKTLREKVENGELSPVKVEREDAKKSGELFALKDAPEIKIESKASKMSKSLGNVINPDDVVSDYGADSLRLYEMFLGPLEAVKPWNQDGVAGVRGFLDRSWRMIVDEDAEAMALNPAVQDVAPTEEQNKMLHRTIKAVTHDIEALAFNTAIARMMEFTNFFSREKVRPKEAMEALVLLVSPFTPHFAEELWKLLGNKETLAYAKFPTWDESVLVETSVEIPVQVLGKLRAKIQVAPNADKQTLEETALAAPDLQKWLEGKKVVKVIVVPGKMVNIVVK